MPSGSILNDIDFMYHKPQSEIKTPKRGRRPMPTPSDPDRARYPISVPGEPTAHGPGSVVRLWTTSFSRCQRALYLR